MAKAWSQCLSAVALVTSLLFNESAAVADHARVSPITNREFEASVVAHNWPSSPHNVYCEAYAFHCRQEKGADFLDALAAQKTTNSSSSSYAEALEHVLNATPLTGSAYRLLKVSVAMRSDSPLCELHRGLARETLIQQRRSTLEHEDAFAVVGGKVIMASQLKETNLTGKVQGDTQVPLIPDEVILGGKGNGTSIVVLYANLDSAAFASSYRVLQEAKIQFVVRFMGEVGFEDDPSSSLGGTILQGYGMRLDIRNVEYKVFDDRSDGTGVSDRDDELLDLNNKASIADGPHPQMLAGVNLTALGLNDDDEILKKVWSVHDQHASQSRIIPPVWRRRKLAVQATAAILSSQDPLVALQQISQDLPSLASTLVNVDVPEEIHQAAEALQDIPTLQAGLIYINGRMLSLSRPSFNVFELLNVLQEEELALQRLHEKFGSVFSLEVVRDIQLAWTMGKKFLAGNKDDEEHVIQRGPAKERPARVDVGRGWKKAVMYLNDLEKDQQYAGWSRSLRQMFMNMQMGMAPSVRRNLFTILAVIDPLEGMPDSALTLGQQLMQSGYPARMGYLIVDSEDIKKCERFLKDEKPGEDVPCPVPPLIEPGTKGAKFVKIKAGAQGAHALLLMAGEELADKPGAFAAYGEYLISMIREARDGGSFQSLDDLLSLHSELYEGMRLGSKSRAKAEDFLLKHSKDERYGHALRFAAERNLKPGMSFLNGRPLPIDAQDDSVAAMFGEEQNHVFGMIMNGEITESSPKSVYASLLTGDRVFKKAHPLLTGDVGDGAEYRDTGTPIRMESLMIPSNLSSSPKAAFLIEGVFDFSTPAGISLALQFITIMHSMQSTVDDTDISIAFRIVPSTNAATASTLCVLFANAGLIGADLLKGALSEWDDRSTVEAFLKKSRISMSVDTSEDFCVPAVDNAEDNFILANGRKFSYEGSDVVSEDIDLLLSIELERAKKVADFLKEGLSLTSSYDVARIGSVSKFLSLEAASSHGRSGIDYTLRELRKDESGSDALLRLSYNKNTPGLHTKVLVTVDPVSVGAQRVAPLLHLIRDGLQLSLDLVLMPPTVFSGDSSIALTSYYRFVADIAGLESGKPAAHFSNLPTNHVLTLRTDVPEAWDVQQTYAIQDTDNLRCELSSGCGDTLADNEGSKFRDVCSTRAEYGLSGLLVFGQCYEANGNTPNGLQLVLVRETDVGLVEDKDFEVSIDGTISETTAPVKARDNLDYADTLVMKTMGYWQLRANPGMWRLSIAEDSKGMSMFDMVDGEAKGGRLIIQKESIPRKVTKTIFMKDFVNRGELLLLKRKPGVDAKTSLFYDEDQKDLVSEHDTIHVFSLATGHLYERFLKIMMLSVTKRTNSKVKFWLFENFLSPTFKSSAKAMMERIGGSVEFVTYKWPEWLRGQSEKQRIIWGYKILFLDVLFPLNVKKIIYVDADQVVRGDLKELWDLDLEGAPYGYTPFCTSRKETLGYQFWRDGFWKNHLGDRPYHISALYVVDLEMFRRKLVGDQLRSIYQQLSADPNSLSNLDQDLPNYAQHSVPIFSLPQEWLWCESWCSDDSKASAKTIDLCNNPMHKEPKVSMAKRIISGPLFKESWVELDAEVENLDKQYEQQKI